MKTKLPVYLLVLFSFLGFLDATYLTILHYQHAFPPCSLKFSCETVLTSKYATLADIPIALFGAGFYLGMLILSVLYMQDKKTGLLKLIRLGAFSGALVSLVLIYLQAFVLHAFCMYCLASETLMFGIALIAFLILKNQKPSPGSV